MNRQALDGVKVLDFGWILVGALISKQLGDHGAQVVRVESRLRPDYTRTNRPVFRCSATNPDDKPQFAHRNTSKYSITINLKHPDAHIILDKLIRWADVVLENFTPGTMTKLGLDYEYMRKINPGIVMASSCVFGQTGPLAKSWGVDGTGSALSGRLHLMGWPDRGPLTPSAVPYGDGVLPLFAALAVVAALDYKRRTGKGQYIDASMFEVCANQISPVLLDWSVNKHLQNRNGNRVPSAAPHGAFPCLGDDRWCAVGVFTEQDWQSFCDVLGNPDWTKEPRFSSLQSRKDNEDELEKLVAEWTKQHSAEEVMHLMQASGVSAGIVQNAQDLVDRDPQLKERQFLVPVQHPVLGTFGHQAPPYKLLKTKAQLRAAPCLGEHAEYVCTQLLGVDDKEFTQLLQSGVFE